MKANVLQVLWHEKEQVLSCDFEPSGKGRLATAGGDSAVRIWQFTDGGESKKLDFLATLSRHEKAVNVVRWAPQGGILASAGDDACILLWQESDEPTDAAGTFGKEDENYDKESWRLLTMMRGTLEEPCADIYDLAWSPDGRFIISGSIDYKARIWDVTEGKCIHVIRDHNHFVQGVAWDPRGEYLATQSSDRTVNIYKYETPNKKFGTKFMGKLSRLPLPREDVAAAEAAAAQAEEGAGPAGDEDVAMMDADNGGDFSERPSSPTPAISNKGKEVIRNGIVPVLKEDLVDMEDASVTEDGPAGEGAAGEGAEGGLASEAPGTVPPSAAGPGRLARTYRIFHDDALKSFFRRLTFSTDGSMLLVPAGQRRVGPRPAGANKGDGMVNTVYVFARSGFHRVPIAHFPGHQKPAIAVRFNPIRFAYRTPNTTPPQLDEVEMQEATAPVPGADAAPQTPVTPPDIDFTPRPMFQLPARLVWAVATTDSVVIYDTQQHHPICAASNLHLAPITDLCWSNDGNMLMVSSADGYCSLIHFQEGELGPKMALQEFTASQPMPKIAEMPQTVTPPESPAAENAPQPQDLLAQPQALQQPNPEPAPAPAAAPPPAPAPVPQKRPVEVVVIDDDSDMGTPNPAAASIAGASSAAAPSNPEEIPKDKKRRIAPTLISTT